MLAFFEKNPLQHTYYFDTKHCLVFFLPLTSTRFLISSPDSSVAGTGRGGTEKRSGDPAPPGHGREGQEGEARGAGAPFPTSTSQFVLCFPRFSHVQSATSSDIFWLCVIQSTASFPPQVQFAAYKQFCDDTTVEKQRAIKEVTARERNDPTAGLASPEFFFASFGSLSLTLFSAHSNSCISPIY